MNDKEKGKGFEVLLESLITGNVSQAIENQEKREQKLVKILQILPKKYHPYARDHLGHKDVKKAYEKLGVKILKDYDDLFFEVKLPKDWEIQNTEHSMWNELLDDKKRKRAIFFYKGAFYDRDAFITFETRYIIQTVYVDPNDMKDFKRYYACIDNSIKKELFKTEIVQKITLDKEDELRKLCEDFLNENYPNWKNEFAYW